MVLPALELAVFQGWLVA